MFFSQRCFAWTRQAAEQLGLPEWDEENTIPAAAAAAPADAAVPVAAATSSTDDAHPTHTLPSTAATETAAVLQRSVDRKRYQPHYDHLRQKVRTSPVYYHHKTDNCYLQMTYLRFE